MNVEPVSVLLVDDHPMFRDGVATLLATVADIEVVGCASSGQEAVEAARMTQPDVVVMDLRMRGLGGIEATRQITSTSPHIAVLVLTMFEDDDSVFAAIRAGARGYLLKEADEDEIIRAVRGVANGEAVFGPGVAMRVLEFFAGRSGPTAPAAPFPELTEREREVLELVAQGRRNADIAHRLYLSFRTVRNHVSNIFTKLAVAYRAEAIVRAREAGLGQGG